MAARRLPKNLTRYLRLSMGASQRKVILFLESAIVSAVSEATEQLAVLD